MYQNYSSVTLTSRGGPGSMSTSLDVVVVGGGVIGLSCAYQLAQRGLQVVLLEQAGAGENPDGGSHGESRIIRLVHSEPHYIPLAVDAYREWRQLEHRVGAKLFENHGALWIDGEQMTRKRSQLLDQAGAPNEVLTSDQIHERYPHLNYDNRWFGVLDHTAGTIYARKTTEALKVGPDDVQDEPGLQKALRSLGVTMRYNTAVTSWNVTEGGVTVHTKSDVFGAKWAVFAVGGWLNTLVPGLPIRVRPSVIPVFFWDVDIQGQALFQPANKSPNLMINDFDAKELLFMIPEADFPGKIKFAVHSAEEFDITKGIKPRAFTEKCREMSRKHLAKHIRFVETTPTVEGTCLYDNTDDGDFVIDRHPQFKNVILAAGFSGTGFKFGPTIGTIVADLVQDQPPRWNISGFSVHRHVDCTKAKI